MAAVTEALAAASRERALVPLAVLLRREATSKKMESPDVLYGQAGQSKKGEDYTLLKIDCRRDMDEADNTFSVFAIFDGHNGSGAAIYAKENLLENVLSAIPTGLQREEWLAALPRALVAGFVKTDKDFQVIARTSGTTVTFIIIDGWVVTVASVGDSRCILESAEGSVYYLSADHRLDTNEEEVERITASGGAVGRLHIPGGGEIGPLRCWPGGLCLSRSIGDMDVGEFIVPVPHVKQVKLSNAGGRLIISSDGVWDALTPELALNYSRGLPAETAAYHIVKQAVGAQGLRDDTTCIVIDILPPEKITPSAPTKKSGIRVFKNMFHRKSSEPFSLADRDFVETNVLEELFEEESAFLSQRLNTSNPIHSLFKLCICAICQINIRPNEGFSILGNSSLLRKQNPWDGPFLCGTCIEKKEAMEGKRLSRDSSSRYSSSSE